MRAYAQIVQDTGCTSQTRRGMCPMGNYTSGNHRYTSKTTNMLCQGSVPIGEPQYCIHAREKKSFLSILPTLSSPRAQPSLSPSVLLDHEPSAGLESKVCLITEHLAIFFGKSQKDGSAKKGDLRSIFDIYPITQGALLQHHSAAPLAILDGAGLFCSHRPDAACMA